METRQMNRHAVPDVALADDLRNAKYAELASRAQTEQARRLVQAVFEQVVAADNKRSRGPYADTKQKMLRAVEGFIGDLVRAAGHRTGAGWVYRPLSRSQFSKQEVSYRAFMPVVKGLQDQGFVEHIPHLRRLTDFGAGPVAFQAYTSRFRATPKLLAIVAEHGIGVDRAQDHFAVLGGPKSLLVLRAASTRKGGDKLKGQKMPFARTEHTQRLELEVAELNEFLDQFELGGGQHRGYFRMFNCGDDPNFGWNLGGRLYSHGEGNYQQLKERQQMTINGEAVAEIDIKASYLTIYLSWFGQQPPGDPYQLPGFPEEARDFVKLGMVPLWGNGRRVLRSWPKKMIDKYHKDTGRKLGRDYSVKVIQAKLLETYPALMQIAQHPNVWAKLMFLESEAVVTTMLRLMREKEIPSYSVHDSLIVPVSRREMAEAVLGEQYLKVTGAQPKLVVKVASAA